MTTVHKLNTMTRRAAAGGGLVYALACLSSRRVLAAAILPLPCCEINQLDADLYAFPATESGKTVIALTASAAKHPYEVQIHAGSQTWAFASSGARLPSFPTFIGKVASDIGDHALDAFVIEVPNGMLEGVESSGIWAERFSDAGERQRVGSPFLPDLLRCNSALAGRYHSISPSDDRKILFGEVADAIALKLRNIGYAGKPVVYGRRLAAFLLPDVLHYNPELPQGFSFAAQNGRHPGEDTTNLTSTLLNGLPVTRLSNHSQQFEKSFPYFPVLPVVD